MALQPTLRPFILGNPAAPHTLDIFRERLVTLDLISITAALPYSRLCLPLQVISVVFRRIYAESLMLSSTAVN